jgi:exosortase
MPVSSHDSGRVSMIAVRHVLFASSIFLSFVVFHSPLRDLLRLSSTDDLYSHIPFMPILIGAFFYGGRRSIFSRVRYSPAAGAASLGLGILFARGLTYFSDFSQKGCLTPSILSVLSVWVAVFICFYGFAAFRRALFPFALLLFVVPVPESLTRPVVLVLQDIAVNMVDWSLSVLGAPVIRDGNFFRFPRATMLVAEGCVGLHSLLVLVIVSMMGARLFLRGGWMRVSAVAAAVPVAIAKNALRIVALSLLILYAGEGSVLTQAFHKHVSFSIPSVVVEGFLIWLLRRWETKRISRGESPAIDDAIVR